MHVMVLGGGVVGVTTAWYLRQAGFEVSVIERQSALGLETSFANGSQISVSHPQPWASPETIGLLMRWMGRADAPIRFRLQADTAQWLWVLGFLHECLPSRFHRNTAVIARLALYSAACLQRLNDETGIAYDHLQRGILHVFFSGREFREIPQRAAVLAQLGIETETCSPARCAEIEPALLPLQNRLAGGLYARHDHTGDAFRFTQVLGQKLAECGVQFHLDTTVEQIVCTGTVIEGVEVSSAVSSVTERLQADAYVVCLGSFTPRVLAPLGERLPIYPLKGYSATFPVCDEEKAPVVSLTDESHRIVCSRLGDRLRVAGMAELDGYNTKIDPHRAQLILDWVKAYFPGAVDFTKVSLWAGLRPATPGNVPIIGKSRIPGLWYNCGHGSLGWTLSCGSAAALAGIMQGKMAEIDFPFLNLQA